MKNRTEQILLVMHVLAWIVFFGLIIKAGAIIVSYVVSTSNAEGAKNLYRGMNLFAVQQFSFWQYTTLVSFMVAILFLEANIAYLVTRVLSKIKMTSPFTIEISKLLEKISYTIFGTWLVVMLYNGHTTWLAKRIDGMEEKFISGEFILLAGVVFVISQIFKKGVELQTESELTV